eukprot:606598-Amphidinium_carterae.1
MDFEQHKKPSGLRGWTPNPMRISHCTVSNVDIYNERQRPDLILVHANCLQPPHRAGQYD